MALRLAHIESLGKGMSQIGHLKNQVWLHRHAPLGALPNCVCAKNAIVTVVSLCKPCQHACAPLDEDDRTVFHIRAIEKDIIMFSGKLRPRSVTRRARFSRPCEGLARLLSDVVGCDLWQFLPADAKEVRVGLSASHGQCDEQ